MLSGRIPSLRDESNAIFIDRDPKLFSIILNYLRTKEIDLKDTDLMILRHEAEFYNISPLVKRLMLCEEMDESSCGDVLFYGYLPAAEPPEVEGMVTQREGMKNEAPQPGGTTSVNSQSASSSASSTSSNPATVQAGSSSGFNPRPGQMVRMGTESGISRHSGHSRTSSWDLRVSYNGNPRKDLRHSRNSSADFNKYLRTDLGALFNQQIPEPIQDMKVQIIKAHHNCIAVAYAHYVACYCLKDSFGWQLIFTSPYIEFPIERLSINAKVNVGNQEQQPSKMIAISYDNQIRLWGISENGSKTDIGTFNLFVRVEYLFFINTQLVALSSIGKIGVWHAHTQHYQIQDLGSSILSFDFAGSFLLLGSNNGKIYYIDMQKFPLRMKDNDLLVTELYKDPSNDQITSISVYLTPKSASLQGELCGF